MSTKALRELCEAATPGPWVGVIKPNGKGTGLVGAKAKRGMGEQGCIAVVNSIPGGAERIANTKLIASAVNALPALLDVAEAAQATQRWCDMRSFPVVTDLRRALAALDDLVKPSGFHEPCSATNYVHAPHNGCPGVAFPQQLPEWATMKNQAKPNREDQ